MRLHFTICSLLLFLSSFSQTTTNPQKINTLIQTYFQYDREYIHVQFNKNIYENNEDLGFKGYVWSKNNNSPNSNTANVQLVIYNEQQEIIQELLLFTSKGTFAGGLHLNKSFKPGKYYFHFYTNWMNNFTEDSSFMQTIEIIDKSTPYNFKTDEPIWETAKITLYPESGSIINDIINTVGVCIRDCNQKGIEIQDGIILDSKSNEVSQFRTNKMGNGAIYFIPKLNESYSLKIKSDKLTLSMPLPKIQETGIIVTYNNNLPTNKLLIAVKTNEKGAELYQNKKLTLLIQQDKNFVQQEIIFSNNETEKTLLFDKKNFPNGVNSIRLIDEDLNEISERLVYIYPSTTPITTLDAKIIANDSIQLSGIINVKQANLSISVLPENNVCMNQKRSIIGTFYLNTYLENPEIDNYSYYDLDNKSRKQDMELLMLNQNKSKFLWNNIKSEPLKIKYNFEKGVTISGKVGKTLNPNSKYKVTLVSFKDNIFDEAIIDKNNDFKFENFFVQDSTVFALQMINPKNIAEATKMEARVSFKKSVFTLPLQFNKIICPAKKTLDKSFSFTMPKVENITNLNEVVIKAEKKEVLLHEKDAGIMATAYKVREDDFERFLDFLTRIGYRTGLDDDGNVTITSNRDLNIGSSNTPAIYIDNIMQYDNNFLFNLFMNEIDEIYVDKTSSSDISTLGGYGTIKIFLRQNSKAKQYDIKYTSLIAKKGFARNIEFKNSQFENQQEFYLFGTLNWTSELLIKENPNFEVKFPRGNQEQIQVLLEGFTEDGELISEIKKLNVMQKQP